MSIDPADYWMTPDEERRLEDKLTVYAGKRDKSPCSSCLFYESEWDRSNQEDDGADQFSGLCDFHDKWVDFDETCKDHKAYYPPDNYKGMIKEELNSSASMTREQYDKLKASGMMWEMHPFFTGDYHSDMQNH